MKIAIIGGGWTGLVLAHRLSGRGHDLYLYEKEEQLGGLATYHDYNDFFWDRFYHVILPTDKSLISFLEEIGLGDKLRWHQTLTGYYVDRQFYPVSTTREFLKFPPLGLLQKFRLGMTILLGSRISNWKKLEKITVEDWLINYSGKATYEKFWKPLLLAKLGENYKRVSAVFIWTYIKRLFEARDDSSSRKEQMGYLSGGYKTALDHLENQLPLSGVAIRSSTGVEKINPAIGGGLTLNIQGREEHFDKVVFTGPINLLQRVADESLLSISGDLAKVEYLGVVCMVLVLRKPITPYYVLNIADTAIPFTAVIGMSTLVDTSETAKSHLVYLPKYVLSTDPFLRKPGKEIEEMFLDGLFKMYPDLEENDIVSTHINRAFKVQPLQVLNYSSIVPKAKTQHPDFYILNTSQLVNNTLNNNSVTEHVDQFVAKHAEELAGQSKLVS